MNPAQIRTAVKAAESKETNKERVNHPEHYQSDGNADIECIDAIEAMGIGREFCVGNAVKYLWRAGKKDGSTVREDMKKAIWYLARAVERLEDE